MTEQERIDNFRTEFAALRDKYGLDFAADLATEVLQGASGKRVETKPIMTIVAIEGWQPPVSPPNGNGKDK